MRIARVLTRMNFGGPARQVLASDPRLVARGHEVRVFTGRPQPGEGDLFDEALALGIDIVRVPGLARGLAPVGNLRAQSHLARALVAFRPEIVHTHASKAGLLGRRAARRAPDAARVHTFHGHVLEGYFPGPIARRLVALETRLAKETDRVVAVSHATAEDLVRLGVVGEERLVVIPPGVELDPLTALPPRRLRGGDAGPLRRLIGAAPTDTVVGVVGRLADVKQPLVALAAFALLAPRYAGLHVVFIGDGAERRALEGAIGGLAADVRRRAHLVGARDDVAALYGELDVVLNSSRSEGLPVALIEAGAAALPSVAFAVGGVEELVVHERTGLVVPPADGSDGLAFALARLLDDLREAGSMGERARLKVVARHSGDALADRLEALYAAAREDRRCAS